MAKGVYVGVGGVAKKVKKLFVGVGGAARKVKKVFIGIGGITKLVYSAEPSKVSNVSPLSVGRSELAGGTVGNYAVFAGGWDTATTTTTATDAYDRSLVKQAIADISVARQGLSGGKVGNYLLFAGGYRAVSVATNAVDSYDTSLVRAVVSSGLCNYVKNMGTCELPSYVIFAGGTKYGDARAECNTFNTSLVRSDNTYLSAARYAIGGAVIGGYAIFAGGYDTNGYAKYTADAFNNSLVRTALVDISTGGDCSGASNGNYALFAGGNNGTEIVSGFNSSLVKVVADAPLDGYYNGLAGAKLNNEHAVFSGGAHYEDTATYGALTVAYDNSLVRSNLERLSVDRGKLAGISFGNRILFGGGKQSYPNEGYRNTVDVYEV